ncbi:MAG: DUF2312 domain-containing protein [Alphaproteobacteria bacterium]|nr:DUF2312 domain-containing protein [Alphaproteobacteria bacterium]MBL0717862.1 DUF2312 domain-containing protein [Alphaproteobacteria bacterium]
MQDDISGEILNQFIERIELLQQDQANIQDDIKSVYQEAVSAGFERKFITMIIKLRKMSPEKRLELDSKTEMYRNKADI